MCWQHREQARFADGTYKPIPVPLDYPPDHFAHLSVTETESESVAYTPCEAYGGADRQVRLKFGRYLKKTFPALTDAQIQSHVTEFKAALMIAESKPELKFATDRETINRIFETPMRACGSTCVSCMCHKFADNAIRPYHVYADSPDVAVAYVVENNQIKSRSVVSTKDKTWVRCYSIDSDDNDADCGTLKALLTDAGYTGGDLHGNRLTKLDTRNVMLPYIDNGGKQVRDDGRYWVVVPDGEGEYEANCTDGTADECAQRCSECEELEDECRCIYCNCCAERYADGCERCSMCEHCGSCITHVACSCDRCSECGELIESYRYCTTCECDRCSKCNELTDDCECDKCDECGRLTDDCECEDSDDSADEIEAALTPEQVREKLNRIWIYLQNQGDTDAMAIVKKAFDSVERSELVMA